MTRWAADPPRKPPPDPPDPSSVTDDPLAALGLNGSRGKRGRNNGQVYSVSRVNPLFHLSSNDSLNSVTSSKKDNPSRPCASTGYKNMNLCDYPQYRLEFNRLGSGSPFDHVCGDKYQNFRRSRATTSDYSRSPTRERSPEIDYDDSLPQDSSRLPAYDEHEHDRYLSNRFHQMSSKSHSLQEKSGSSGYGGSNGPGSLDNACSDGLKFVEEVGVLSEQNPAFVKSIRIAGRGLRTTKSVPSQHSSSSGGGTLTTIPEGRVDLPVPQPIWPGPLDHRGLLNNYTYDSLVDEALLLYTSLSHQAQFPDNHNKLDNSYFDTSVKELLMDILASINQALENKTGSPEEMLKIITEKVKMKLEFMKHNSEEEMKRLCVNLSNSRKVNCVLRAFSHSSSSGQSSSSARERTSSSHDEDIYHIPSGSSSSGFSDSPPGQRRTTTTPLLPHFYGRKSSILSHFYCDHDTSTLSRGIRNALIYGTLCRQKMTLGNQRTGFCLPGLFQKPSEGVTDHSLPQRDLVKQMCENGEQNDNSAGSSISCARSKLNCLKSFNCDKNNVVKGGSVPKGSSLGYRDERPSVWQLYYGMKAEGSKRYGEGDPKDVPVFPGGRPEADFTLDVPRSELLSKRLRDDKKWRFRCRVLTSFLGLVFFLLSVMAVSLILTRGKRMFGSMV